MTSVLAVYFSGREFSWYFYFGNYFPYDRSLLTPAIINAYCIVLPILYAFLRRVTRDLFSFLLTPIVVIGGVAGSIVTSFADLRWWLLITSLYLLLPLCFSYLSPPTVRIRRRDANYGPTNLLLLTGSVATTFYIYLLIKYRSMLSLPSLNEVYEARYAFGAVVAGWEQYGITISKYAGAFCLVGYAVQKRSPLALLPVFFIYSVDYSLAGHKLSLGLLLMSWALYYWFGHRGKSLQVHTIPAALSAASATTLLVMAINPPWSLNVIGLWDRLFLVPAGLFARYYDFASETQFYWGGPGILGQIFGGLRENYYAAVGEHYFGPMVSANADLISDAYINFGITGVFASFLILRLLISERDNRLYRQEQTFLITLMIPYSFVIFSTGLQTAMITGGFLLGLLILKSYPRQQNRSS
ncbi:MAG: hypothetical protein WBF99_23995 [Xanthobacteraceae bacterium]